MKLQLVSIFSLVGKDVAGKQADIRSRQPDGSLMYESDKNGPVMVKMEKVVIKKKDGKKWLYWYYDGASEDSGYSCGYSGVEMETWPFQDWNILIDLE